MANRRQRSPYSPAVRAQALELFAIHGGRVASERTGVAPGTIRQWVRRESALAAKAARTGGLEVVDVDVGSAVPWPQRRPAFVAKLAVAVERIGERLFTTIEQDRARDTRDFAVAAAVLLDKLELLSGAATSRHESYHLRGEVNLDAMRAEVAENRRRLAALEPGDADD